MFRVVVQETAGLDRSRVPISFGVPLPGGRETDGWCLVDGDSELPLQWRVVESHAGRPRTLAFDALLPTLSGNERRILRLGPGSPSVPNLASAGCTVRFDDAGLSALTAGSDSCLLSLTPTIGTPVVAAPGGGPGHRQPETVQPSVSTADRLSTGPILDRWRVSGSIGDDDAFAFETRYRCWHHFPRVDVRMRLRNRGAPTWLTHVGHRLSTMPADAVEVLARDLRFDHLVDVNLAADTLNAGWSYAGIRLTRSDRPDLTVASRDLVRFADGMITVTTTGREQDSLDVHLHRIEPVWHYRGITSHAPIRHLHFHEGQTRSASFSLFVGDRDDTESALVAAQDGVETWAEPDGLPVISGSPGPPLLERTLDRALGFVVTSGEYAGLIAGGRCHLNNRLIEPGVNRADYAEYLLNHFCRTGSPRLLSTVRDYADAFVDLSVHRSDRAPEAWGAVRQRYRENLPDPVRSMRGPRLLLDLFDLTGCERYHQAALEIAGYVLRAFPDRFARQGGTCRELAALYDRTGDDRYLRKTHEILDAVRASQLPDGPWYEYYEADGTAATLDVHQAGLYTVSATEKPEMTSYNLIGILDAAPYVDVTPWMDVVEKAADWMTAVQDDEGAWRFPRFDSDPQWGHGIFQDVLAMLLAYRALGKPDYLAAADRGIAWAERVWNRVGYIPSVTRVSPHDRLEASLTYFYGIEALSLRAEA